MNNEERAEKIATDLTDYTNWALKPEIKRKIHKSLDEIDSHVKRLFQEDNERYPMGR